MNDNKTEVTTKKEQMKRQLLLRVMRMIAFVGFSVFVVVLTVNTLSKIGDDLRDDLDAHNAEMMFSENPHYTVEDGVTKCYTGHWQATRGYIVENSPIIFSTRNEFKFENPEEIEQVTKDNPEFKYVISKEVGCGKAYGQERWTLHDNGSLSCLQQAYDLPRSYTDSEDGLDEFLRDHPTAKSMPVVCVSTDGFVATADELSELRGGQ